MDNCIFSVVYCIGNTSIIYYNICGMFNYNGSLNRNRDFGCLLTEMGGSKIELLNRRYITGSLKAAMVEYMDLLTCYLSDGEH